MANELPIVMDLSRGWSFTKRRLWRWRMKAPPDPEDEVVDLPHCWNSQDDFQEGVVYYRGWGTYRKTFPMPQTPSEDMAWTLESEGFYGTGDVWLNGRKVADVDGQYLGFSLDVGKYLLPNAENTIGIRLTNRCSLDVLPGIDDPDFLLYGGLAGRLSLVGKSSFRFNSDCRITCQNVLTGSPSALITFGLTNSSDRRRSCSVRWVISDTGGKIAAEAAVADLEMGPRQNKEPPPVSVTVPGAGLWSPERPVLYQAVGTLFEGDRAGDSVSIRFGFRDAVFRPGRGFFLNGERVELHGCNRHASMPGFGNALPESLHRQDTVLLRKLGCNFVRLSHYPQHPAFLDACDELGILVYAEIATWKSVRTGKWLTSACRQMRDMVVRDRNHPSIIIWGMGNESRSRAAYLALRETARKADPTRPVTYAENHLYRAKRENTLGIPDVWGCNYELDVMEEGRDASTLGCMIVTECSNSPHSIRGDLRAEIEQVGVIEKDIAASAGKPFVAGFALWSFNDYGTFRKKRYFRHSGIVDAWRLPKMSAALMQARYSTEPCLRIFGAWEKDGEAVREIHIFTNCEKVVLSAGGRELCTMDGGPHHVRHLAFEPGELLATGWLKGRTVCDRLVTGGAARRVVIEPEYADSQLNASFLVRVVDREGNQVWNWHGEVAVGVRGGILRSYTPRNTVRIGGGIGRGFVTGFRREGAIALTATAAGLDPGRLDLRFP